MRQGQAECLGHHLRGCGRAQELATASGRSAGLAAELGCFFERQLAVTVTSADGLDLAGIFAICGGSVTPPGTRMVGRSVHAARAIIMAGRPLSQVAMPSTPLRVGNDRINGEIPWLHRCEGQAIHHARGSLSTAIARIGHVAGEGMPCTA